MANPNEVDEVNSGALAMIIAVVAFATLGVALVVTALVRQEVGLKTSEGMTQQDRPFRDGKNAQLTKLNASPTFVDKAKGLIAVPIDRAMELTLAAVRKNPYALTPGTNKPENLGGAGNEPEEKSDKDEKSEKADSKGKGKPAPAPHSTSGTAAPAPVAPAPAPAPVPTP